MATSTNQQLEEELQKRAPRVIKHMNDDHVDSIIAYVLAFGNCPRCDESTIETACLTGLDRTGFFVQVTLKNNRGTVDNIHIPYQSPVTSPRDLHMEAVRMHRQAYDQLGVAYKLRHGYYQQVTKMIAFHGYKQVKANPTTTLTAVAAVVVAGVLAWRRRR